MAPKLGMGLYGDDGAVDGPRGFNEANLIFAKQLGATHIVLHLPGQQLVADRDGVWAYEDLVKVVKLAAKHDLVLHAIENFSPAHWYKILLDLPGKEQQMQCLQATIRNMGRAGIPVMGYCFTLTGVYGRVETFARGGATSVGLSEDQIERHVSHHSSCRQFKSTRLIKLTGLRLPGRQLGSAAPEGRSVGNSRRLRCRRRLHYRD